MRKPKQNIPTKRHNYDVDYFEIIAKARGIKDLEVFLNPEKDVLHDGIKMKNMIEVTERIKDAIYSGEKIGISYDCRQNV